MGALHMGALEHQPLPSWGSAVPVGPRQGKGRAIGGTVFRGLAWEGGSTRLLSTGTTQLSDRMATPDCRGPPVRPGGWGRGACVSPRGQPCWAPAQQRGLLLRWPWLVHRLQLAAHSVDAINLKTVLWVCITQSQTPEFSLQRLKCKTWSCLKLLSL